MKQMILTVFMMNSIFCNLCALGYEKQQMFDAVNYYQAEDYSQAREYYQKLLLQVNEDWQKAIIKYNLATTYLAEGDYVKAIRDFQDISLGKNPFPLILRYVKTNLAVARWRQAKKNIELMDTEPNSLQEDYLHAFFLLSQALQDLNAASDANCDVNTLEGDSICIPAYDLSTLQKAIQQQLAQIHLKFQSYRTASLTPIESLSMLIGGVHSINNAIKELIEVNINSHEKNQHIQKIVLQAKTWEPLWHNMSVSKNLGASFDGTENQYVAFLELLQQGNLDKATKILDRLEVLLNSVFSSLLDNDPTTQLIQKLITSYQRSITSIPLQEGEVKSLSDQQTVVMKILKVKELGVNLLEKAQDKLRKSLELSHEGKNTEAKIFLLDAYQNIQLLSWENLPQTEVSIEIFLQHAIALQTATVMVGQLNQKIGNNLVETAISTQNQATKFSEKFWGLVEKQQLENFAKPSVDANGNKTHRCQFQPWNEVVALFNSGYNETITAESLLRNEIFGHTLLQHQDQALRDWKKALNTLKNPPPPQDTCNAPQSDISQSEPDRNQDQQQSEEKWDTSIDEVLRLLQAMEQDDRQKKVPVRSGVQSQEKAW
ncbi:MAG: tetratricopeptide repeat protein [Chlamydiota bacterium]|nr:tetratricopeptide repeat protein [Chlamydiota bacterium]